MAFALVVAACSSGDGDSLLERSAGSAADSDSPLGQLPIDVGNLPGVSGECEALLSLFLSIGGAFLGGEVSLLDSAALASLPAEIRDDAQVVSETLRQFSDGLQALGINFADPATFSSLSEAQQAEFEALTDSLDSEQFDAASDSLSTYGEQQCGDQFGPVG
jgi:hypothetical protein